MRKFWGYTSNVNYSVGCTGGTVYIYDCDGTELAKFKDIPSVYSSVFSPDGNLFVARSTRAYFGVYSLNPLNLKHKVRFSNVDGSQDDGYTFSKDNAYFYNIERQQSSTNHAISVYDTSTFHRVAMFLEHDNQTEPCYIESNKDGQLFVLGFLRGKNGVISNGFVSKFDHNGLKDLCDLPEETFDFYKTFKHLELLGFTNKAKEWCGFDDDDDVDMNGIELKQYPLSELWEQFHC